MAGFLVAPLCPSGQAWKVLPALGQESLPVDRVERVGKVNLDKGSCVVSFVAFAPLLGDPEADFCAKGLSDADLQREEKRGSALLIFKAQTLGSEATPSFPNGDCSDTAVFFWYGSQVRTS